MLKRFIKDSATYGIGRVAAVLLGFATLPILTNHLSVSEYGTIDLLILCVTLLNLTVAMEISQAVPRFLGDTKDTKIRSAHTSTALFFSLIMYFISGTLVYIFHNEIGQILFKEQTDGQLILFLIPWFILHGVNYFVINQLRWEGMVWPYVILRTLNGILMLLAIIWLLVKNDMKVEGVLYSYIFSLATTAIIGALFLVYKKSVSLSFCKIKLKNMLAFSFPLVPSSAALFAQNYIDRIMITNMLDLQSLGLYSFAFKIASVITLVSVSFQMSVTPLVYQLHKNQDTPLQIARSFNIFLLFVFIAAIGICLFIPELFHFFIGKNFYSSAYLIPILCFSIILASVYVFAPGISIAKKTKIIAIINVIGMLLNIVLNVIFIKYYGLIGAAIATFSSLAIVALINFKVSAKYYPIPYFYSKIATGTSLTIAAAFLATTYQNIGEISWAAFITKMLCYIIFSAILSLVFVKISTIKKYILKRPYKTI